MWDYFADSLRAFGAMQNSSYMHVTLKRQPARKNRQNGARIVHLRAHISLLLFKTLMSAQTVTK